MNTPAVKRLQISIEEELDDTRWPLAFDGDVSAAGFVEVRPWLADVRRAF